MQKDWRLLACRAVFFFLVTSSSGIVRYLAVFLNELDITTFQIGIVIALRPGVSFFASFFWGYLADIRNSHRNIMIAGSIISSLVLSGLLLKQVQHDVALISLIMIIVTWFGTVTQLLDAITILILHDSESNFNDKDGNKSEDDSDSDSDKKKSGQYGETRLWGAVGWGLGSVVCGFLVTYLGEDIIVYFYQFNMSIAACLLIFVFPLALKSKTNNNSNNNNKNTNKVSGDFETPLIQLASTETSDIAIKPDEQNKEKENDNSKDIVNTKEMQSDINSNGNGINTSDETNDETDNVNSSENGPVKRRRRKISIWERQFIQLFDKIGNLNGVVFFVNLILFGIAMSFVEEYLFLFLLRKLDARVFLCGLTITMMVSGEVPMFKASNWLLKKIGIAGLLFISHIAYVVRVFGYTLLPQHEEKYSYFVLLLEPLHGLTFAGMWIASVEYGARIVPKHLRATMQGLITGVYAGLSACAGSLLGGWIWDHFGPIWMYRMIGIVIFVWMIVFQVLFRIGMKRNKQRASVSLRSYSSDSN